jgi:hypothetical protein
MRVKLILNKDQSIKVKQAIKMNTYKKNQGTSVTGQTLPENKPLPWPAGLPCATAGWPGTRQTQPLPCSGPTWHTAELLATGKAAGTHGRHLATAVVPGGTRKITGHDSGPQRHTA